MQTAEAIIQSPEDEQGEPIDVANVYYRSTMLARLNIGSWHDTRYDRDVSEDVARRNKVEGHAGKYLKKLVEGSHTLTKLRATGQAARTYFYQHTRPWLDGGERILPNELYFDVTSQMRKFETEYFGWVDEFIKGYPDDIKRAQARLKGMFKAEDYPDPEAIRDRFYFAFTIWPFPNMTDWRCQMADEDREEHIRAAVEQLEASHERMAQDLFMRMFKVVENMHTRLADTDMIFRDSLVGNVRELVDLMPKLNITNDPRIDELVKEARMNLCSFDAQTLRDDRDTRKKVAKEAEKMVNKLSAYLA